MRPVCVAFTPGGREAVRVEEWNYQRFRDSKLQRDLLRLIFIFTTCRDISIKCEFYSKHSFQIFYKRPALCSAPEILN